MTTHLTHDDDPLAGEDEPELVIIDDEEFEAAHRAADSFGEDGDGDEDDDEPVEFEFSFEEDLDEAIALDMSDEMDPTVEEADERMAPLFLSQRDPVSELVDDDADGTTAASAAASAAAAAGAAAAAAPALSKQEARAEEKRQREVLKRRKEMDKAALLDEQERQRDEKARAAAAEKEALAAQKEAAEAEKRDAAEAKKQQAEDKKRAAADAKQQAADAKQQAADEKKQAAEDKKQAKARQVEQRAEEKRSRAERKAAAKRRAARPKDDPIPAGLTRFVVDEEPETAPTVTRKDATAQKREGTKRSLVVMVVVLLVVAGVAVYAISRSVSKAGRDGGGTSVSSVNALPAALTSTASANTADVAYALDIGGAQPVTINGGGSVDLATQGSNLSVTYSVGGRSFPEQIVYDGAQSFYDLGQIVRYFTPGYEWVSMDLASGGFGEPGVGIGGVLADPTALVSLLQASASSAHEVGNVQIDGAPATEYSISLDQAAVTRMLTSSGLPAFVHTTSYSHLNLQAYVNGSGRLSRIAAGATYLDSGQTVTASTTLDLSHYGTPVSVAPPPAPQVVPEQQFEASAARLTHAPTS